jgi:NhaP-type Na+/H+ or K+/H+ antiporter
MTLWYFAVGLVLVSLTFTMPLLQRLPVSPPTFYLAAGLVLGPGALGLLSWDVVREARLFERVTELAVLVSLFTVGLSMRRSLKDRLWLVPLRLATLTMIVTIGAIAIVGVLWMGLSIGAAILLGAILAPTDPVLASDVQLQDASDRDELRYGLSGEAGLNDGAAFPFVMLGLGLLGLHSGAGLLGGGDQPFGLTGWLLWDVVWAVAAGLAIGGATGWLVGRVTLLFRRRPGLTVSLHEFLVLGVIALSYATAELVHGYGFLSVFAAGYAVRYIELRAAGHSDSPAELPPMAPGRGQGEDLKGPEAAQFLAASLVDFNDKLEHVLMASVVILVGGVLTTAYITVEALWLAPLLFFVIRPLAVAIGLVGSSVTGMRRTLMAWFGIRGIGSVYYLTYAIESDLAAGDAERLTGLVLCLVVASIVLHGVSVAPLMGWYERRWRGRSRVRSGPVRRQRAPRCRPARRGCSPRSRRSGAGPRDRGSARR